MADETTDRHRDVDRWVADHPDTDVAARLRANPPVHPDDLAKAEAAIRAVDPQGIPARCAECGRRMPMIQRDMRAHPKCTPPQQVAASP